MARVKICGITNVADARVCVEAGADMLGFLVVPREGAQFVSKQKAAEIIAQLPDSVMSVVATLSSEAQEIVDLVGGTHAKAVQLHGETSPETVSSVRRALPETKIFKVIHVIGEEAIAEAQKYESLVDAILLDTATGSGERGGTGATHDWSVSKQIVEKISVPIILAGGLNPENVEEAIATVHPYGVDVRSGVSNSDGTKDLEKVRQFIAQAKSA